MSAFVFEKDADGIVTVTMGMSGPVNCMNREYREGMEQVLRRIEAEPDLTGVVIASAKKVFFAGGDLHELQAYQPGDEATFMDFITDLKGQLRRIERLSVPVAAAINGAALGGGMEICLACNYRVAVDDKAVLLGFPEVTLGLLPGAGGIVRTVHLIGLEKALPILLEGKKLKPKEALAAGLIHELAATVDQLIPRAKAWILAHKGDALVAVQPWDQKDHKIPGGRAGSPALAQLIAAAPPMLRKRTRGLLPAPERILDCAIEATRLPFDTALRVESRGLTSLVTTPQAKNLIATFFQMAQVNSGASRPKGFEKSTVKKVGVLGAGMMGQGIAYVSAMAGVSVVLRDLTLDAARKGRAYSEQLLAKRVAKGSMNAAQMQEVLERIQPSADDADLHGCDLIIETVFENFALKQEVIARTCALGVPGGFYASNTSSLPISQLAQAATRPEDFVGLHFFSPVDKMPLVEIISGAKTSDATLAKAFDFALQLRKTPIVVNDSLGFFTSRTFGTYLDEGARLLHEGLHPVQIDAMGKAIGMPVGPLTVQDEVSLELSRKLGLTWAAMGVQDQFGEREVYRAVIDTMVAKHGRGGRHHGGGYYDYHQDGSKTIWPQLLELFHRPQVQVPLQDMKDRLLFRPVIETLKCLEEGVLRSVADANIGSLMGIGAPTWTGGYVQFVNSYGLDRFVVRCRELAGQYGARFDAPKIALEQLAKGKPFV